MFSGTHPFVELFRTIAQISINILREKIEGLLFSRVPKDGDSVAGLNCEECFSGKNTVKIPVVCFSEKTTLHF